MPLARVGVWCACLLCSEMLCCAGFPAGTPAQLSTNLPEFLPEIRRIGRIWQRICQILKNWLKVSSFRGAGTPEILKMQPLSSETWARRERKARSKRIPSSCKCNWIFEASLRQVWSKFTVLRTRSASLRSLGLAPLRCARSLLAARP